MLRLSKKKKKNSNYSGFEDLSEKYPQIKMKSIVKGKKENLICYCLKMCYFVIADDDTVLFICIYLFLFVCLLNVEILLCLEQ